ncbi:arabinosidase [Niastella yeongjuensis]|uniref:Arabinosidase n=1 Tax=Niastella yeongjuensis TaxID=354355 RepID=A0A1V9DY70_9BACT|nr:glycoside hydrolase family 43 protein [Niastella yeongjuensis]OQP38781.1 arabinosidase [Niastella yeongjuensis]SEO32826.1 Glycosyl hydrolases family 43 [Niastella yeongjuensis]
MRNLLYIACLFLAACSSHRPVYLFTSFHEPAADGLRLLYSYDGYKWTDVGRTFVKPEVGSKVMRDPSIAKGADGEYRLVWTSGWKNDKGFGYAHSKDLIHWSTPEFIPVMEKDSNVVNVWAPEIFFDDENNQFIIVWASTIPFRFPKGEEAEDNNHRLYYTVTKDFKTFSPSALYLDPKFSVIDAEIVKRAPKDYVLVLKDNTRPMRNIKVAFGNTPLGPWNNISAPFTQHLTEGPSVAHVGKDWLIYFDSYGDKKYEAVKTTDFIHFDSATVSVPEGHKHGTIFMTSREELKKLLDAK